MNDSAALSNSPSTFPNLFNFKYSSGARRKRIESEEDDDKNYIASKDSTELGPPTVSARQENCVQYELGVDTGNDGCLDYSDASITWAFQGKAGCPVSTEQVSRISKKVFSQSTAMGVTFPILYACVDLKDIAENRIFIYDARTMICERHFFWREENLKFENKRTVMLPKSTIYGEIQWHVTISRLISGGNVRPFQRREYRRQGQEYDNVKDWTDPYIYVLYTGVSTRKGNYECFNLNEYIPPKQHGNSKLKQEKVQELRLRELMHCTPGNTPVKSTDASVNNDYNDDYDDFQSEVTRPYVRTNFIVRHAMKQELMSGSKPMIAQEKVKRKALSEGATASSLPRNRQQLYDCKRKIIEGSKVEDPLWEVFKFAQSNSDIVPVAGISQEKAYAAVVLPKMVQHVNEILQNRAPVCMHYDSTYNVGQYYVSILAFKHPYLLKQPVVPVGFLFHQSKCTEVHRVFMQVISQKVSKLNSKQTVFISDREMAIRTAIKTSFPAAYMAACHDHLKKNIVSWMKLRRMSSEVENAILNDIKGLLKATSEAEFLGLESEIAEKNLWTDEFSTYFQKNLRDDILATSRFKTEPLGVYYPNAGVSNNSSESMNFVYKHFTEVDKCPKTWLEAVQKAYFLMADKYNDVYLALKLNTGDFKANNGSLEATKGFNLSPHTDSLGSEGFESVFAAGKFVKTSDRSQMNSQCLNYKNGLADWLIKMNRITLVNGQFFVRSIGDKTHAVNHIKRECTCGSENCIELMALDKIIRPGELCGKKTVQKIKRQTLTKANEKSVSKSSGKKAHIKVGVRNNIIPTQQPKMRRMDEESDDSVGNSINQSEETSKPSPNGTPLRLFEPLTANVIEETSKNCLMELGVFSESDKFGSEQENPFEATASKSVGADVNIACRVMDLAANIDDQVSGSVIEKPEGSEPSDEQGEAEGTRKRTDALRRPCPQKQLPKVQNKPMKIATRRKSYRKLLTIQPSTNESTDGACEQLRYCVCRGGDYGKMRRCDGLSCGNEWYHAKCLGLSSKELNQKIWLCQKCTSADTT